MNGICSWSFVVVVSVALIDCSPALAQAAPPVAFLQASNVACKVGRPNVKPGETVIWQGQCAEGFAQGSGIAQWFTAGKPSLRFEGSFARGLLEGKGKMTGADGDRYEGDYKAGLRHGHGVYVSANGARFEGEYVNNQRDAASPPPPPGATSLEAKSKAGVIPSLTVQSAAPSSIQSPATGAPTGRTREETSSPSGESSEKLSFAVNACTGTLISVFGIIPRSIDLKSGPWQGQYAPNNLPIPALRPILEQASRFAREHCPTKQCDPNAAFAVYLFYDRMSRLGEPDVTKWDPKPVINASCPTGGATNPRWQIFNNIAYDESPEGKAAKQRQQQQQNAKISEIESQKKIKSFFERNGVDGFYDSRQLNSNPFAVEGKPVLLWAQLSQMLEAKKALLSVTDDFVVVSDVPRGAFGGGYYLFIGKVLGNTNFPGNLTQTPVTHLKFISALPCPTADARKCIQ